MKTVVVKYQTQKNYCACCDQKLPNPVMSRVKEFEFTKDRALSWVNWNEVAGYSEDLDRMVPEYIYETISFFATNFGEKIIIDESEIDRVKEFILSEVVTLSPHP